LLRLIGILNQREMELFREKLYGFIVVPNDQGNMHDRLFHVAELFKRSGLITGINVAVNRIRITGLTGSS